MKLIGAGLPRTGTLSQKVALEMLGLGPCYHMVNVLGNLDLVEVWRRAYEGQPSWEEALGGFESTVDWPGSYFFEELMEAFPDAKVLLSVRDGDAWERSMRSTIWDALHGDSILGDLCRTRGRIDPLWQGYTELMSAMWEQTGLIGAVNAEPGSMAAAMEVYNQRVIDTVPAERLLVWTPSEGWEPLCAFLGLEVPAAPFPRLNDSQFLRERLTDAALETLRQWRERQPAAPAPHAAAPA